MSAVEALDGVPPMRAAFARALLPARRGRDLPDRTVAVDGCRQDAARLADYARVTGFTLRDAVPATWLHVLTFPLHVHLLSDPASPVRLVGAVHVSNSMTMHRAVDARETLRLSVHAEALRPHRRGALVDLVGRVEVDGETVWDGVSTYLAPGVSVPGEAQDAVREPFEAVTPTARWRLAKRLGRDYRRVSQDPNPIHASRLAAKAFGFDRPIIHGMWTHARALAALEGRLPESHRVCVDFIRPVPLPATVGFHYRGTEGAYRAAVTSLDGTKPFVTLEVAAP